MPRRVLVQRSEESFDLVEVPAPSEHHLQEVTKMNPQLIPSEDLGLDGDLLVVGRETTLASGAIDLLCLARSGDLVLIEFKTGPQNPDFRHALAQVIDYGSDLWRMTFDDFDRGVVQHFLSSTRRDAKAGDARTLDEAISATNWDLDEEERDSLRSRLADVLETGDFIYVVAAQRFTEAMTRSLEYLNTTMRFGRFFLVEVVQLESSDLTAHAAQVVARPPKGGNRSPSSPGGRANEAEFLASLDDDGYRKAVADILATCAALDLEVSWRDKGASFRLASPDRAEPISVGWLLPEGSHWQGSKWLSFGVDPGTLANHPSLTDAMNDYVAKIASIPGGQSVSNRGHRFNFAPGVAEPAVPTIREAISELVQRVTA